MAQQSASTTSSANTVLMLLLPSETDGPTTLDDEHIPMMRSDDTENAMSLSTGCAAYMPMSLGSFE